MKILMVLESAFPPDNRVEKEILALSDAGHEVHLACSTGKDRQDADLWEKSVIHRKPMSIFIYKSSVACLKFPFYFSFWRKFIFGLQEKGKYDAIHIHDLPLICIGAEIKRAYAIPLIIDLHENYPALLKNSTHTMTITGRFLSSNQQWIEYEKKFLPEADLIISVVEEARDRIAEAGIDPEKICIVSNTFNIENDFLCAGKRDDNDFTIFYGGAINRHRGLQIVLEAIKLLKDRGIRIRLMVVGSGSYKTDLEKQAVKLKVDSQVKFYGHKSFNEMLNLLAEADAGIIPHLRTDNNDASSPNKLYQYMYLKKAVISSDCISLKRIINETNAGFIYRNDSPSDLAVLLERLNSDRELVDQKGEYGRNAVILKYNWNFDKERLVKAYIRLKENHSKEIYIV